MQDLDERPESVVRYDQELFDSLSRTDRVFFKLHEAWIKREYIKTSLPVMKTGGVRGQVAQVASNEGFLRLLNAMRTFVGASRKELLSLDTPWIKACYGDIQPQRATYRLFACLFMNRAFAFSEDLDRQARYQMMKARFGEKPLLPAFDDASAEESVYAVLVGRISKLKLEVGVIMFEGGSGDSWWLHTQAADIFSDVINAGYSLLALDRPNYCEPGFKTLWQLGESHRVYDIVMSNVESRPFKELVQAMQLGVGCVPENRFRKK